MLHLGFACDWSQPRQKTWSGTPYALYQALERALGTTLHDLDVHLPQHQRLLYKMLSLSLHPHTSRVQNESGQNPRRLRRVQERLVEKLHKNSRVDAVLSISDIVVSPRVPNYVYFDLCVAAFRELLQKPELARVEHVFYREKYLVERERQQAVVYRESAGLFAMSRYAAQKAVNAYGLDKAKVHVVGAGATVVPKDGAVRLYDRDYLLFVGYDFERKAGPLVLQAYALIAQKYNIDLLVAGVPAHVVEAFAIPGVRALGPQTPDRLQSYFAYARGYVMPSQFEAFGIAFAEALAHGVPVIARNNFAMPEMVRHGDNGYLLRAECQDPKELAELIANLLDNEEMQQRVRAQMHEVRALYSWDRVAHDMIRIITAAPSVH